MAFVTDDSTGLQLVMGIGRYAGQIWPEKRDHFFSPESTEELSQYLQAVDAHKFTENDKTTIDVMLQSIFAAPESFAALPNKKFLASLINARIDTIYDHKKYYKWAVASRSADFNAFKLSERIWNRAVGDLEVAKRTGTWFYVLTTLAGLRMVAPERYDQISLSPDEQRQLLDVQGLVKLRKVNPNILERAAKLCVVFADQVDCNGPGGTPRILYTDDIPSHELPNRSTI